MSKDNGLIFNELLEVYQISTNTEGFNTTISKDIFKLMGEYPDKLELLKAALRYSNKCSTPSIYPYIKRIMEDWERRNILTPADVEQQEQKRKDSLNNVRNLKPFYNYQIQRPEKKKTEAKKHQESPEQERKRAELINEINELNKGYNRPVREDYPLELWTIEELENVKRNIILLNSIREMEKRLKSDF